MAKHQIFLSREKFREQLENKVADVVSLITGKYNHSTEELHTFEGVSIEFSGSMNVYKDIIRDLRNLGIK